MSLAAHKEKISSISKLRKNMFHFYFMLKINSVRLTIKRNKSKLSKTKELHIVKYDTIVVYRTDIMASCFV